MTPRHREYLSRRRDKRRRKRLAKIYVAWAVQYAPELPPMPSARTLNDWNRRRS